MLAKHHGMLAILSFCAIACFAIDAKAGGIYLDEDFEGTVVFENQDYPIRNGNVPVTQAVIDVKGINLRHHQAAETEANSEVDADVASDYRTPLVAMTSNDGQVVSTRYFKGTKSYCLESGESVGSTQFDAKYIRWGRMHQFALSTNVETTELTVGTVVGSFTVDYTTDGRSDESVDVTATLNFVVGTGGIDLVLPQDTDGPATIGTLEGGPGNWVVVSWIQMRDRAGPYAWRAYDPLTTTFKGPQPVVADPFATATPDDAANFSTYVSGLNYYVNSNTVATVLDRDELSAGGLTPTWGYTYSEDDEDTEDTNEVGWHITATNGGTLYVDNLYWEYGGSSIITTGLVGYLGYEKAARMLAFDAETEEPAGPVPPGEASADPSTWVLY